VNETPDDPEYEAYEPPAPPPPRPRKRGVLGRILLWFVWIALSLAVVGAAAAYMGWRYVERTYLADVPDLPPREQLFAANRAPAIRFTDRTGQVIASRGPRFGDRVRLSELPAHVPRAFLAVEDRRFYKHGAVDPWAIGRAAWANHKAKRVVEGGSTLTQQLAKGLFLTPEQTLKRKLQEAYMAHRLEQVLTKDEVLELYLNRVYFGANTFGVDGAARTYFGKPAQDLTLAEAALLAALPKAPSKLALHRQMDAALVRAHTVLDRMVREGWITPEAAAAAKRERPVLVATAQPNDGDFGWALDYATTEVIKLAGPNSPDLVVRLTIDPRLQRTAAETVRDVVHGAGRAAGASEGALVALGPDGAIRAMVGGTDYSESVFNRAAQAKRQPGSSFKPFVYATALEAGVLPSDTREDAPVSIGGWKPQNYGGGYKGTVTVASALAQSINTVAAKLAEEVGGSAIAGLAHRFGFTSIPDNPNLSISLGAYEVSVLEMASGFSVFQQAGNRTPPHIIEQIATVAGEHVWSYASPGPSPVYDTARASMMVHMLQGVITHGTGTRAAFDWPAAGKTGTTQNWRDAWFVGFTPEFTAAVWVGNDTDKPMSQVTGGALPAEIWRRFMLVAHEGLAVHDFDWLVPDLEAVTEPDPRNGFYEELSAEFARAQAEAMDGPVGPPEPPPAREPPAPPMPPPARPAPLPPRPQVAPAPRDPSGPPLPWYRAQPPRDPAARAAPKGEPVPY
jgi:penicillin-binding protein 1A